MMNNRSELVREIIQFFGERPIVTSPEMIIEFIKRRDKKNAEPLVKWRTNPPPIEENKSYMYVVNVERAIDATLKNLGAEL